MVTEWAGRLWMQRQAKYCGNPGLQLAVNRASTVAGYPRQPQMVKRVAFKPEESVLTTEMGTCGAPNRLASVGRWRLLVARKGWPPVPVMRTQASVHACKRRLPSHTHTHMYTYTLGIHLCPSHRHSKKHARTRRTRIERKQDK